MLGTIIDVAYFDVIYPVARRMNNRLVYTMLYHLAKWTRIALTKRQQRHFHGRFRETLKYSAENSRVKDVKE